MKKAFNQFLASLIAKAFDKLTSNKRLMKRASKALGELIREEKDKGTPRLPNFLAMIGDANPDRYQKIIHGEGDWDNPMEWALMMFAVRLQANRAVDLVASPVARFLAGDQYPYLWAEAARLENLSRKLQDKTPAGFEGIWELPKEDDGPMPLIPPDSLFGSDYAEA